MLLEDKMGVPFTLENKPVAGLDKRDSERPMFK